MENYFQIKVPVNKKKNLNCDNSDTFWSQLNDFQKVDDFMIHQNIAKKLENIVINSKLYEKNIMNLFIHGGHGTGKLTLARYYTQLYTDLVNPCLNLETIKHESKELEYYRGSKHVELIIYKYNFSDINIIQKFFETVCHASLDYRISTKKIIIIKNIENIRKENIYLVKFYLEKFSDSNAFILISKNGIPKEFLGFLTCIRVPQPTDDELLSISKNIMKSKKIKAKKNDLKKVVKQSGRNLQTMINLLELSYLTGNYHEVSNIEESKFLFLYKLLRKKTIKSVFQIRELLVDLLTENITSQQILRFLINRFLKSKNVTGEEKSKIVDIIVNADKKDSQSLRNVIHLEYACLQIMNVFE